MAGPAREAFGAERASKLCDASAVQDAVRDGQTLAIGGSMFHNKPMVLIRELIHAAPRGLTAVAVPQASIDIDLLIAAGCVDEVRAPYLGFDHLGLAPCFRRAALSGDVSVWDCDETQLIAGLEAAAKGLPSALTGSGVGTDLPTTNTDLVPVADPITGQSMLAVAAIAPDVALLHAQRADEYGNLRYDGYSFADLLIAEATKRHGGTVIASVDEVVRNDSFVADPFATTIAHFYVDRVVEAPFGAHPCSSHGRYGQDERALAEYVSTCAAGEVAGYLHSHVLDVTSHEDYLDRSLKASELLALARGLH